MTIQTLPKPHAGKPTLTQRTTRGVMWVAAQAAATRGVMLVQQLALAWLLAKSDFGLIGLTYTVTTFVTLLANPGVDTVLVKRLHRFQRWATPAFWLGLSVGAVASVVMLVLAPIAAWVYGNSELTGLIAVLAPAPMLQALQIVPKAQLQMQMRFRAIVLLGALTSGLTAVLTISAAALGMGAYSFVAPTPIVSAVVAAVAWRMARPPVQWRSELARWKYLFGDSATVGATKLLYALDNQADYIALGLAGFANAAIGVYVFAFSIAVQPLRLISASIQTVLFPGLSHRALDPEKQVRAALRAMRLLTLFTTPICILQVVLAEPMFRLLFPPRWMDAVLPCQILSLGLMFNASIWPANSLMMAQGRFRELLLLAGIGAFGLIALLGGGIWSYGSILSVAVAVTAWHVIHSPIFHWVATRHYAPTASFFLETYRPFAAAMIGAVPCALLERALPEGTTGDILALVGGSLIFLIVYLASVFLLSRHALQDLFTQLAPLLPFLRRFKSA
jgi:O-antigen/teichoic acid export membrane protein